MDNYKLTAALDNCVNGRIARFKGKNLSEEVIIDYCINIVAAKPDNLQKSQILKMYQTMKITEQSSSKPVDHGSTSTTPINQDSSDIIRIEKMPSEALRQQIDHFLLHPEKITMSSDPELLAKVNKLEAANTKLQDDNNGLNELNTGIYDIINVQNISLNTCGTTLDTCMTAEKKLAASTKYINLSYSLLLKIISDHPELVVDSSSPHKALLKECTNKIAGIEDINISDHDSSDIYINCLHSQNNITWPAEIEKIFDSYSTH